MALPRIAYLYDTTITVGGPVKRDRLWFFGAYEDFRNKQVNPGVVLETAPKTVRQKPTFKVSAKISQHDTVDFSHTDNYHDIAPAATIQNPPVTAVKDTGHAPAISGHWARTSGSKTVFELKGGGLHVGQLAPPHSGNLTDSGHMTWGPGLPASTPSFPRPTSRTITPWPRRWAITPTALPTAPTISSSACRLCRCGTM